MSNISISYPDRATGWISVMADYLALTKFRIGMLVLAVAIGIIRLLWVQRAQVSILVFVVMRVRTT